MRYKGVYQSEASCSTTQNSFITARDGTTITIIPAYRWLEGLRFLKASGELSPRPRQYVNGDTTCWCAYSYPLDVNRCFAYDYSIERPNSESSKHKASSLTPYKNEMSVSTPSIPPDEAGSSTETPQNYTKKL